MNNIATCCSMVYQAYTNRRITLDEFNWISNVNIAFAPILWMEYENTPEADEYKRILDKTGYLPPIEWMK